MTRHFRVSVADEESGFSVEVREQLEMTRGRAILLARESVSSTPEEIGDVVREAVVTLLHPIPPPNGA